MKKFHFAIKSINDEILRHVGKVAMKAVERGHDPSLSTREAKVKHLKEAIEILQNHPENKHV